MNMNMNMNMNSNNKPKPALEAERLSPTRGTAAQHSVNKQ
jgi:hypothetical protein